MITPPLAGAMIGAGAAMPESLDAAGFSAEVSGASADANAGGMAAAGAAVGAIALIGPLAGAALPPHAASSGNINANSTSNSVGG
jgi:hypothetical protein